MKANKRVEIIAKIGFVGFCRGQHSCERDHQKVLDGYEAATARYKKGTAEKRIEIGIKILEDLK